jgi:hypothetical protein
VVDVVGISDIGLIAKNFTDSGCGKGLLTIRQAIPESIYPLDTCRFRHPWQSASALYRENYSLFFQTFHITTAQAFDFVADGEEG